MPELMALGWVACGWLFMVGIGRQRTGPMNTERPNRAVLRSPTTTDATERRNP